MKDILTSNSGTGSFKCITPPSFPEDRTLGVKDYYISTRDKGSDSEFLPLCRDIDGIVYTGRRGGKNVIMYSEQRQAVEQMVQLKLSHPNRDFEIYARTKTGEIVFLPNP